MIAYHAGVGKSSNARRIAADLIPAGAVEEELRYPVTTGSTDHPGGYAGAMAEFYEETAARLAVHLEAGRTVVLLAEGDPLFYGSFMYMHDRLADRFPTEVVPGVPAFAAATAAVAAPLVRQTDVLTILPGTLPEAELARRLADTDGAIIMKLGRTFPAVRSALAQAGRLDHAVYVERASMPAERWMPVADVDPASVPYFSLIVVSGDSVQPDPRGRRSGRCRSPAAADRPGRRAARRRPRPGPGRVAYPRGHGGARGGRPRRRLRRLRQPRRRSGPGCSGTRRATPSSSTGPGWRSTSRPAASGWPSCPAATPGSSGWRPRCSRRPRTRRTLDVPVRVLPGVTAVQAVAARAGAPVGGDFAVLSLSDRLKPWAVIERRLRAVSEADLVLAIYNPASRSRTDQVRRRTSSCSSTGRRTPWWSSAATSAGPRSRSTVTTLAELDAESIDMKCLLIVGASTVYAPAVDRRRTAADGLSVSGSGRGRGRRGTTRAAVARVEHAADQDDRGLAEPGRLDLVGDVGERCRAGRARSGWLARKYDDDRAVGAVVGASASASSRVRVMARCSTSVAPVAAKCGSASASGIAVERACARVSTTDWAEQRDGQLDARRSAAAAAYAGTPGVTSHGTPASSSRRVCSVSAE